jgi:DNA modification methylase
MTLRSTADVIRTLESGTYTLSELYEVAEQSGLNRAPGALEDPGDGSVRWKHRVRSALQTLKSTGMAHRVGGGAWAIAGSQERPRRAILLLLPGDPDACQLMLSDARELLSSTEDAIDLVVADPPWALGRDRGTSGYGRDPSKVVSGYVEVEPARWVDFMASWVTQAAEALRPGGYLAIVTGPQLAARAQVIAEDEGGLTYVNSIVVPKRFGMFTRSRFVHAHTRISLLTKGPLTSVDRTFLLPADAPRGRTGHAYMNDVWADAAVSDVVARRRGLLRYDNALPVPLVSRIVETTTRPGDLVADPFLGSGTSAVSCLQLGRRFIGGDLNPESLRFTMARVLEEVLPSLGRPAVARTA